MAPKIRPNPQLKNETKRVKKQIMAAALAVLLQYFVPFYMILLMGLLSAKVCPSTSINIICMAKTSSGGCQTPCSQNCKSWRKWFYQTLDSVINNASRKVKKVSNTAMVKGVGNTDLNTLSTLLAKLILEG